ncbi:S8 family serine peptidase [Synechococcus sp. PCC 7336]|uniref:S8 family peptidase n=1 Tax=Synechococcus sp. PCC 7336 TaxID=195250 RepID=UPI00034DEC8D|nr:S8 family serine peptidase [Synechococcus sp. PCC 7336]
MSESDFLQADYSIPAAVPEDLTPGFLVAFEDEAAALSQFADGAGIQQVAHSRDYERETLELSDREDRDVIVFDELGVALVTVDPERAQRGMGIASASSGMTNAEPEPIFYALSDFGLPPEATAYLRGYNDAVNHLQAQLTGLFPSQPGVESAAVFSDSSASTWGLMATEVMSSKLSGDGVKVAVLDTGMDLNHPDFAGRSIVSQSFIPGQAVDDRNGHGTHCIGTACGPRNPGIGPRYGVAYEAEIFAGKVLSNQGSSLGRSTIAGIEWALRRGCDIISMSLGGRVSPGEGFSPAFERVGRQAMRNNCLIVAAAGNESDRRRGQIEPVGSPANCPSFMAVAAVDSQMRVANFSNGGINRDGRVDIAGPGVAIYSSAPDSPAAPLQPPFFRRWSNRYDTIGGTSMATPHVSGIAALYRQANPSLSASQLWRLITSTASPLPIPSRDVGAGLVQAPTGC